jgi:peroxiredoxin
MTAVNASNTRAADGKISIRELAAALIVFGIGVPLVFMFARVMAEGEARRRETPLRAMVGDEAYAALTAGQKTELHYMGSGLTAPDFELRDQHGKLFRLSEQRGKVVVLNFWSITCAPCVEEMPGLITLAEVASRRNDMEVIALSSDKNWSAVSPLFPPGNHLRVVFDPDRKIIKDKFGSRLFPETWIIDKRGVIRMRIDGPRDWGSALAVEAIESFL